LQLKVLVTLIHRASHSGAIPNTAFAPSAKLTSSATSAGSICSDIPQVDRLYGAVDVFLKRSDISEESKRKLLVDNTARFYGL
jgi:hypothetical protein